MVTFIFFARLVGRKQNADEHTCPWRFERNGADCFVNSNRTNHRSTTLPFLRNGLHKERLCKAPLTRDKTPR